MDAIIGKTTEEAVIVMMIDKIAKRHNCEATLDFDNEVLFMDGEVEDAILAMDEVERTFKDWR